MIRPKGEARHSKINQTLYKQLASGSYVLNVKPAAVYSFSIR